MIEAHVDHLPHKPTHTKTHQVKHVHALWQQNHTRTDTPLTRTAQQCSLLHPAPMPCQVSCNPNDVQMLCSTLFQTMLAPHTRIASVCIKLGVQQLLHNPPPPPSRPPEPLRPPLPAAPAAVQHPPLSRSLPPAWCTLPARDDPDCCLSHSGASVRPSGQGACGGGSLEQSSHAPGRWHVT